MIHLSHITEGSLELATGKRTGNGIVLSDGVTQVTIQISPNEYALLLRMIQRKSVTRIEDAPEPHLGIVQETFGNLDPAPPDRIPTDYTTPPVSAPVPPQHSVVDIPRVEEPKVPEVPVIGSEYDDRSTGIGSV